MGSKTRLQIFTYDISSDSVRRKVARALEDRATRVQYSVFEARLTPKASKNLETSIRHYLQEGDSLRIYTIGKMGERHCRVVGDGIPVDDDKGFWLL